MSSASGSPPDRPSSADAAWILALDASTPRAAIALGTVDRRSRRATLRATFEEEDGANQASTWLVDKITSMTQEAGISIAELTAIACGVGPGTFTGTRIAVASAQGLALGVGCPCYPISTLAAIAGEGAPGEATLALLDARRGEVYGALFRVRDAGAIAEIERLSDDRAAPVRELLAALETPPQAVLGPGVAPSHAAMPAALQLLARPGAGVSAAGLWRAAVSEVLAGEGLHPRALEARYLRGSYAELGVNTPKRPMIRSPFAG